MAKVGDMRISEYFVSAFDERNVLLIVVSECFKDLRKY